MMSFRLPLWVYWTLAGLAVAIAAAFSVWFDWGEADPFYARRLAFTVWGGPVTLTIAATLVTWLKRMANR